MVIPCSNHGKSMVKKTNFDHESKIPCSARLEICLIMEAMSLSLSMEAEYTELEHESKIKITMVFNHGSCGYTHITAPNKNGTQQKRHPLMPLKINITLQIWHMTNTPSKIDKYDTHKMMLSTNGKPCKNVPKGYLPWAE